MTRLTRKARPKRLKPRTPEKTDKIRSLLRDGLRHKAKGRYDKALSRFDQVFRIEPENTDALYAKCQLFFEQKEYTKALYLLERCRRSKSNSPQLHYIIAYHYHQLKRHDKAVTAIEAALKVNPDFKAAKFLLAKAYSTAGHEGKAKEIVENIPRPDPAQSQEAMLYASLCADLELFEPASEIFPNLLRRPELVVDVCQEMSKLPAPYLQDGLTSVIAENLSKPGISNHDRVQLLFAAGRIEDREKRFDEAFRYFERANDLIDGEFDLTAMSSTIDAMQEVFTSRFEFERYRPYRPETIPVFIVGMPRSGKTTLETELSRADSVADAKERDMRMYIDDEIFVRVDSRLPENFADRIANFPVKLAMQYAQTYLDQVLSSLMLPQLPTYVINTMPLNFLNAGTLKILFPNAKFINMKRDPLDTCWFCYSKNFKNEYYFTNQLHVLGKYYRQYEKLTGHWKTVLPDCWLDVSYEELVSAPAATIGKVSGFIGINGETSGLSNARTGEEITDKYVGYWKNYEAHLKPLIDELKA